MELFEEVHRANMSKQYGIKTGVGKAFRGAGYEPPGIREVLEANREQDPKTGR